MKSLSVIDVQKINSLLKEKQYDYVLRLQDVCGSQSLSLETTGETVDIQILCDLINEYLQGTFKKVKPGTLNPNQIIVIE